MQAIAGKDGKVLRFDGVDYIYSPGRWVAGTFREVPSRVRQGGTYHAYPLPWKDELVVTIPGAAPSTFDRFFRGKTAMPSVQETWRKK